MVLLWYSAVQTEIPQHKHAFQRRCEDDLLTVLRDDVPEDGIEADRGCGDPEGRLGPIDQVD